jgi:hypothetical protein
VENLYIWHRRDLNNEVYPAPDDFIFKSKSEKDTLTGENHLVITNKKYTEINFDYYDIHDVKLVSEDFLSFINKNGIDDTYYEKILLRIVDSTGKPLTGKNYFALHFIKYDDAYFNFHEETRELAMDPLSSFCAYFDDEDKEIQKEEDRGNYLYPDITLKEIKNGKNVFVISKLYYKDGLLFNEKAKNYILGNFCASEIYKTGDFPKICNHCNSDKLPDNNEYRIHT